MQLNIQKQKPNKKWADDTNRHFFKEDRDGQKAHEKMLNIANYCRNANQNYHEVSPHTATMAIIKKSINNKCWGGCGEMGTLLHC